MGHYMSSQQASQLEQFQQNLQDSLHLRNVKIFIYSVLASEFCFKKRSYKKLFFTAHIKA